MKYKNYKVVIHNNKFNFGELSKMTTKRKPITNNEYWYIAGRLFQGSSDFITSERTGKVYTVGGSDNNYGLFEIGKKFYHLIFNKTKYILKCWI